MMASSSRRGHILFAADPVSVGVGFCDGVCVGVTLSCLLNILCTSGRTPTTFSWIDNEDTTKHCSEFGDLDLILKVTTVQKLNIL